MINGIQINGLRRNDDAMKTNASIKKKSAKAHLLIFNSQFIIIVKAVP